MCVFPQIYVLNLIVPTSPISSLEMLREGLTLRLDGLIPLSLRSLSLSGIGIDAYGSIGRGANISSSYIGGGDDASSSGRRDTYDASTSGGGADMS